MKGRAEREFFVKLTGQSYWHCTWITELQVRRTKKATQDFYVFIIFFHFIHLVLQVSYNFWLQLTPIYKSFYFYYTFKTTF